MFFHNDIEYKKYKPPTSDKIQEDIDGFLKFLLKFCYREKLDINNFIVDQRLLIDIFFETDRQKLRYKIFHNSHINELKEAGILAYWIIRRKPLVYRENEITYTVGKYNELFSLFLMFSMLESYRGSVGKGSFIPNPDQLKNIKYTIFRRPLSEDIITTMLEIL